MSGYRIAVSACLLGELCRYDGKAKKSPALERLFPHCRIVPVCPECDCGFGVPREPVQLELTGQGLRMMTVSSRKDVTPAMEKWIGSVLEDFAREGIDGFVLKSRSPSCGWNSTPWFLPEGRQDGRNGLFAAAAAGRFPQVPIADEIFLEQPDGVRRFLELLENHRKMTAD